MPTVGYYTLVESDATLKAMAEEMKAFAHDNPLSPDGIPGVIEATPGDREMNGPLMRIHGPEAGEFTNKYSRFITFSAKKPRPLQVNYVEYRVPDSDGVVKQLMIANNGGDPLLPQDVTRIGFFFLNMKEAYTPPTVTPPPHVAILFNSPVRIE